MSLIQLYDGSFFDIIQPELCNFDIDVIARSLSHLCRFNGHCERFYSVAQHCVMVSELCSEENALAGLLHDATEAFVGDMPSPLKRFMDDYRRFEEMLLPLILERFELPGRLPSEVKRADQIALMTEARDLLPNTKVNWSFPEEIKPVKAVITPWEPEFARKIFIGRFQHLQERRA